MYAIVDIAGQQFKVEKDQKLFVHRLDAGEGERVSFDRVLLIDNDSKISVGEPILKGASVSARVISHMKGDKVLVFKKKRRKGYQKLNGHRQYLTQIQIEEINEKSKVKSQKSTEEEAEVKPGNADTKPVTEAKPKPKAQAETKPKAKPEAKPKAKTETKPKAETKPKPEAKPKTEPGKKES